MGITDRQVESKKILSQILIISVIISILLISTLIILTFFINPNQHKGYLSNKFKEYTGREIIFSGPIDIKFFPHLHFHAQNVKITNPPQFKKDDVIHINSIDINAALFPMLFGTIKIKKLVIDHLKLNLLKKDDINNWTFKSSQPSSQKSSLKPTLILYKLDITGLQLNYSDKNTEWKSNPFIAHLNESGGVIKIYRQKIEAKEATLNINNSLRAKVNGSIATSQDSDYKGLLLVEDFSVSKILQLGNFKLPPIFNKVYKSHMLIKIAFQGTGKNLNLTNIDIRLNNTPIKGTASIGFESTYKFNQKIVAGPIELANYLDLEGYKINLEATKISGAISMESSLNSSTINGSESIDIHNITLAGFSTKKFNKAVNKAIDTIRFYQKLTTTMEARATLSQLRIEMDKLQGNQQKNYKENSDLGSFHALIIARSGIMTTPVCKLNGSDIQGACGGEFDFQTNNINYLFLWQILPTERLHLLNYLYLPYKVYGNKNNIQSGIDWSYTLKQLIEYLGKDKKPLFTKLHDNVSTIYFLKNY